MLNEIKMAQLNGVKYSPNAVSNNYSSSAALKNNALERMPSQDSVSFGSKTPTSRYISYPEIMEFGKDIEYSNYKDGVFSGKYTMTGDNGVNTLNLAVTQKVHTKISGQLGEKPVNLEFYRTSPTGQGGYVKGNIGDTNIDVYYAKMGDGIRIQKISKENETFIPLVSILIADKISFDEQMNFI